MKVFLFSILVAVGVRVAYAQSGSVNAERMREAQRQTILLANQSGQIPLTSLTNVNMASVHVDYPHHAVFDSITTKYWATSPFYINSQQSDTSFFALHDKLKLYNLVLVTLSEQAPLSKQLIDFINDQRSISNVVIVLAGNGNNLARLEALQVPVIWCKADTPEASSVAAQLIFGGIGISNRLDATYGNVFKRGSGYSTTKSRLGYAAPETVSIKSDQLIRIDSLVQASIAAHVTPGAVVLLAKDGDVIFHKAYGNHTYAATEPTKPDDIFDLASVTKVSATTPAIMRLYDKKRLSLTDPISRYVARTRTIPDKATITIREALLHEAGYTPYIKFYESLKPTDVSTDSSAAYPTKVADHYFLRANYFADVMWPVTLQSKGETRGKFVYSDVSMYMLKEVVETASHQPLNEFVFNELYRPLGMRSTGYLPRNRFPRSRIVPTTENDNWFRNMLVQGYVNDPGAAMAGGVEGHAGLFGNANDLAILYQMYLNRGTYGGVKYIEPSTIDLFTAKQSAGSGRGYGFDRAKPADLAAKPYPSSQAFGHSGYTGTYVWVDPKYNMVYICLTNRVYPDDSKTYGKPTMNIRAMILDTFYDAVTQAASK